MTEEDQQMYASIKQFMEGVCEIVDAVNSGQLPPDKAVACIDRVIERIVAAMKTGNQFVKLMLGPALDLCQKARGDILESQGELLN